MKKKDFTLVEMVNKTIISDKYFGFTLLSIASTFGMILNSVVILQPVLGTIFLVIYFIVNGTFIGHMVFKDERPLFKLFFGLFALLMLIVIVNAPLVLLNKFNVTTNILSLNCITVPLSIVNRKVRLGQSMDSHEHTD